MPSKLLRDIHNASALTLLVASLFCLFFQAGKMGPFRAVNPFGDDPYDAAGSLAIQIAFFVAVLTYARALRLRDDPARITSAPLILRGNIVGLSAVLITLLSDMAAMVLHPVPPTLWAHLLLAGVIVLLALVLLCAVVLAAAFRPVARVPVSSNLTIADGLEDLWTLVRIASRRFRKLLPRRLAEYIQHVHPDTLWRPIPWLNPRTHPWRFAVALGIGAGCCLLLGQAQQGAPPTIGAGLLIAGLFLSIETAATLLGYLAFGRYLGLRATAIKVPPALDLSALRLRF